MKAFLVPLKREKLTELVISQIKNLIFSEGIAVGEKLPSELELANQLKISRSVVREALSSLVQSGLIEIRRGRGAGAYVVNHIHKPLLYSTVDLIRSGRLSVRQFLEARKIIECASLRKVAEKITDEDIDKLEEINNEFLKNIHDGLLSTEITSLFHLTLIELSSNPMMTMMLHSILDLMAEMRFRHPDFVTFRKGVYKAHVAFIEAIRQKDWDRSELLLMADIDLSEALEPRKKDQEVLFSPEVLRKKK